MEYSVRNFIDALEYNELVKIKKDLSAGGINLKNVVEQNIRAHQKEHQASCAVCSNEISPESTENYTLLFGPESFKKKATFCALDCLGYFLSNLKGIKGKR